MIQRLTAWLRWRTWCMAATEDTVLARQLRSSACIVSTACSLPERAPATCSMYLQHGRHPDVSPDAAHTANCSTAQQTVRAVARPYDAPENQILR